MNGGELIATGSDSCVFIPNFPCKRNGKVDENRISKIVYDVSAEEDSQYEKEMNEAIQRIKGYSSWAIIFDQFCKPLPKEVLMEYDKKGINKCIGDNSYIQGIFDESSYMMNGIYGGETMDDYITDTFQNHGMSVSERDKQFLELMKMMEPLFLGLKKMKEHKIIHNDIKQNNIVVHDGVFKFIDFGLSGKFSNKQHFKQRSLDELRSDRIYIYYPLEYLLFYTSGKELEDEIWRVENKYERYNYEYFNNIHSMFGLSGFDIYAGTVYELKQKKINRDKMIQGIDVYSLGILIPLLFLDKGKLFKKESQMIIDFYNLFGRMISPLSKNRISAENAYKEFQSLLNKYKKGIPKRKGVKKTVKRKGVKRKGVKRTGVKRKKVKRTVKRRK